MKGAKDIDDVEPELLEHLVEHRARIYDNLASDALSLLSIQLLIIPIGLSAFSVVIKIAQGSFSSDSTSLLRALLERVELQNLRAGIYLAVAALMLTVVVYHVSRQRAAHQSHYLIQKHQPELIDGDKGVPEYRDNFDFLDRVIGYLEEVTVENFSDEINDTRPNIAVSPSSSDASPSFIRALLTLSILLTLSSVGMVVLSLVESVYSPVFVFSGAALFAGGLLLLYGFSFAAFILIAEYLASLAKTVLAVLSGVLRGVFKKMME